MPFEPDTNYRSVPAFNKIFDSLGAAVGFAIETFRNRVSQQFVIAANYLKKEYYVMPFSQFRIVKPDHPILHALILFQGSLAELRAIAFSFPPDLLASFSKPDPAATNANELINEIEKERAAGIAPPKSNGNGYTE